MIAKALKEKPGQNPWVWASADEGSSFMIQQFGLHGGLSTSRIFMFSALKLETKVLGIHKISAYHKQKSSHKGSEGQHWMEIRVSGMPAVWNYFSPGPYWMLYPWSRNMQRGDCLCMLSVHLFQVVL